MSTLTFPKAVLWDMDGTLVDSEPYWLLSESALAQDYGKVWTKEHGHELIGKSLYDSSAILKDRFDIKDLDAQQIIDRRLAPRFFIDLFDDDRAIQGILAVGRGQRSGHHHRTRANGGS